MTAADPPVSTAPWRRRFAVLGPPIIVLGFVLLMLGAMRHRAATVRAVDEAYARIALLRTVRARLVDAETGQRGYLITGDERYLQPFYDAESDAQNALAELSRAYEGKPVRRSELQRLDSLVERRFALMALPITALREGGAAAAREQLIAGRGREAMTELRAVMARIEEVEVELLRAGQAAEQRGALVVLAFLLAGAAVILAAAAYTNVQFRRYGSQLERLHAEERELNARLQEQALELELQSAELQTTNDELLEQQAHVEAMAAELEASNEELQVTNAQLEERTEAAEEANRAKARFLANMSHELRTPLNAIGGYVDLLELGVHGPTTEQQRSSLERIRHNSRHLLLLISDILNFAKIQAGHLEMRETDIPLPELLADAGAMVGPLVQAGGIALLTEEPVSASARGDADRVRQILLNLLSNAVKYTEPGGTIVLRSAVGTERIEIEIRDDGMGIPAELHESIFDPFVQVKRGAGGSLRDGVGLGLSISRELARAMGGDITVRSAPGQGSTFTLTLRRGLIAPQPLEAPIPV